MTPKQRARILAALAGIMALAFSVFGMRMTSWTPLALSLAVYVGVLLAFWPNRRSDPAIALPTGVSREDYATAIEKLTRGSRSLQSLALQTSPADRPLFERMAGLLDTIRAHHEANPSHVPRTRTFVRHTLDRMVGVVEHYADLYARAGSDQKRRLADVSAQIESFVPALEKIDQACIDNDMMALEVSVEVLNEQLDRNR